MAGVVRRVARAVRPRPQAAPPVPWTELSGSSPDLPAELAGEVDEVRLRIDGVSALLALTVTSAGVLRTKRLTLELASWRTAHGDLAPRLGHVAGMTQYSVDTGRRRLVVTMRLRRPVDLAKLLAAVVPVATPAARPAHGAGRAELAVLAPSEAVAPLVSVGDRVVLPADLEDDEVRATDLLVAAPGANPPGARTGTVVVAVDDLAACVDPAVHRPVGRADFSLPTLRGRFADGGFEALTPEGEALRPAGRHGLTDAGVAALLSYSAIDLADAPTEPGELRVLRQLSASGLVVATPALSVSGQAGALASLWQAALPTGVDGLELASMAQRRAAHRDHSTTRLAAAAPTVSVVLCSNRAEDLVASLSRLAAFEYPSFQVVVGLHGIEPPADLEDALASLRARAEVVVVPIAGDVVFGEALAILSARADGALVTKVDDDDHYGQDHLWDLVIAHEYSGAALVGKGVEFLYLEGEDTTVRRTIPTPETYTRHVAGGTMLMSQSDLQAVGGWRPVPRSVDRALLLRVLANGGGVYRSHGFGYTYVRRPSGHTWDAQDDFLAKNVRQTWSGLVLPGEGSPAAEAKA